MLGRRLRHRIAIEEPIAAQDARTGEITVRWQVVTRGGVRLNSVPAEVLTGPGREFATAGAEQADTSARITVRWFRGLTQQMRIVWDGDTYNIVSVATDRTGRRDYRIVCRHGVHPG